MTRIAFFMLLIFLCHFIEAQSVDYCRYFILDVSEDTYDGKIVKSYSPEIVHYRQDKFSRFLIEHENRFSYILWNKADSLDKIASIHPDTTSMRREFCGSVVSDNRLLGYFADLTPRSLTEWKDKNVSFSMDEMMSVASGFFYISAINPGDTTLERKICVGIHGQRQFQMNRDMTLLEAFTFEAIFYYLRKNKAPLFEADFKEYSIRSLQVNKSKILSIETLLSAVQNECYGLMSKNEDLKDKLVKYYKKNRHNLNFKIPETGL